MQAIQPTLRRKIIAGGIVLLAIALIAVSTKLLHSRSVSPTSTPTTTMVTNTSADKTLKDGTFLATGHYDSPGGTEAIKVSVTLRGGVVTDSTVSQAITTDSDADEYQHKFMNGYKPQVIGKKITSIHLSRVSGSSLTSQGFNNALDQIIGQAKG